MTDNITLPRSVVEQAIRTIVELEYSNSTAVSDQMARDSKAALRAALEQPQVEQGPIWYHKHWAEDNDDIFYRSTEVVPDGAVPLYLHPQNLNCKSNQARLATLWGYVKEQPQVEQPVAWIRGLPEEATHIAAAKAKVRSGGQIDISIRAFKYDDDDGVLMVYVTDNDNEYPGWRKAADAFYHLNFPVIPISTHPQPPRRPLTDEQITELADEGVFHANVFEIVRRIEEEHGIFKMRDHGIGGEK